MTVEPALAALVLLGAALGVAGFLLGRRRPAALLAVWLLVVCFVPIWVEVRVLLPWSAASGIALLGDCHVRLQRSSSRLVLADLLMCFLFVWAMTPFLVGRLSLASFAGVLTVWIAGYGLGRVAPTAVDLRWIYGAVGVAFTGVAVLAIIEFVTGWHGLASWGPANATRASWQQIQVRGGLERSEGAFGHSIASGSVLGARARAHHRSAVPAVATHAHDGGHALGDRSDPQPDVADLRGSRHSARDRLLEVTRSPGCA